MLQVVKIGQRIPYLNALKQKENDTKDEKKKIWKFHLRVNRSTYVYCVCVLNAAANEKSRHSIRKFYSGGKRDAVNRIEKFPIVKMNFIPQ